MIEKSLENQKFSIFKIIFLVIGFSILLLSLVSYLGWFTILVVGILYYILQKKFKQNNIRELNPNWSFYTNILIVIFIIFGLSYNKDFANSVGFSGFLTEILCAIALPICLVKLYELSTFQSENFENKIFQAKKNNRISQEENILEGKILEKKSTNKDDMIGALKPNEPITNFFIYAFGAIFLIFLIWGVIQEHYYESLIEFGTSFLGIVVFYYLKYLDKETLEDLYSKKRSDKKIFIKIIGEYGFLSSMFLLIGVSLFLSIGNSLNEYNKNNSGVGDFLGIGIGELLFGVIFAFLSMRLGIKIFNEGAKKLKILNKK